jgi:hypothetical protein
MRKEVTQPKPVYQKPEIHELGHFAQLTLGNKSSSLADLAHGINTHGGGIGS